MIDAIIGALKHEGLASLYSGVVGYGAASYLGVGFGESFSVAGMQYSAPVATGILTAASAFAGKMAIDTFAGMSGSDPMTLRVESGMPSIVDPLASGAAAVGLSRLGLVQGSNTLSSFPLADDLTLAGIVAGSVFVGDRVADMHF
jgi:hypothetical protein